MFQVRIYNEEECSENETAWEKEETKRAKHVSHSATNFCHPEEEYLFLW
jgi:hypothetical protein